MNSEEKFNPDFPENDNEFQMFLEMIKSGAVNFPETEDSSAGEFPDLMEDLVDPGENMCPALSSITDVVKDSIDSIGFLGIRWSDKDMIDVLKALGYKESIYTIELDLPKDMTPEEQEVMGIILPDNKIEVPIVKKGRSKITNENFHEHKPGVVFEREMASLAKSLILDLIERHGKGKDR